MLQLSTYTDNVLKLTATVCEQWPSRLAGREACLKCADFLRKHMHNSADQVEIQEFDVHPDAFLGYIRVTIVMFFIALVFLWLEQVPLLFLIVSLIILLIVLEFFIYKEVIDPFFPKRTGKNVIGTLEPSGEVKQQIIISGHHDSAHIFNFLAKKPHLYAIRILSGMGTVFGLFIVALILWVMDIAGNPANGLLHISQWIFTLLSPLAVQLWFFYSSKGTPGAGDNMASTAVAMEVGRHYKDLKSTAHGLKHTRLIVASWDAEEAGLRGARAYNKTYAAQLHEVPTFNFNIECLYDLKKLFFLTSDINGFVSLSKDMASECQEVANELGYKTELNPIIFLAGGTDAGEFAKRGIEATTIVGMDWKNISNSPAYHTLGDTIDAVDPEAVAATLNIAIEYVKRKDEKLS